MKNWLTLFFVAGALFAFGQDKSTGVISGTIIDSEIGEGLPSAQIELVETTQKLLSDVDGTYKFGNLKVGSYTLKVSYPDYPVQTITGINVKAGEVITVDVVMKPLTVDTIPPVIVYGIRKQDNDAGFTTLQAKAIAVGDGMSKESIGRTPSTTTGDVLKMVSGASIQDNKFAVIRGLNDRYNAAFLNGAPLPSTESDRKAFSFDIFPANMLDNLIITKSATPDQPAEFAGGLIQINTISIPTKNFLSFGFGGGLNTITTFKDRMYYKGGKTDWLGFDDGTRAMSSSIPAYGSYPLGIHDQANLAQSFSTDWKTYTGKFSPNYQAQFSFGNSTKVFGKDFGVIGALTYNRKFEYNETVRRGYTNGSDPSQAPQLDYEYNDHNNVSNVLAGALLNFTMRLNERNNISFKNIYSLNSSDKLIYRTGEINPLETNPNLLRSSARWFTSNQVYSGQLTGDHLLKNNKFKVDWLLGYSNIHRSVPNLSRNIYTRNKYIIDPSNPNPRDTMYVANISYTNVGPSYGGGMFFSDTKENSINERIDLTYETKLGKTRFDIKVGVYNQIRNRNFEARQLGYTRYGITGGSVKFDDNLLYLPEDQIFAPENMGIITPAANGNPAIGGFKLTDGTKFSDAYTAQSVLNAAYVMGDNHLGKLRLIYGARVEHFTQKLNARRDDNSPLEINTTKLDVLPSLNAIFKLRDDRKKSNLRLSYSQTLNRPEYRELAPFAFFDFTTNFVVSGNDTLKRAKIHNVDFRYEVFPGRGQIFSATVFYKRFENPIEQKSRADVINEITFQNVPSANNYGLEFEARSLVSTLLMSDTGSFFEQFTIYSNLSIIRSSVDVSNVAGSAYSSRPLQGQSPYVFNAGLRYDSKKGGWGASLTVNRVGQRIAIVGNVNEPDLWEQARTFLDLQITKTFWKERAQFKLNISNILAQDQVFYQNNNVDATRTKGANGFFNTIFIGDKNNRQGYNADVDQQIWKTNFGRTISATLTFKL